MKIRHTIWIAFACIACGSGSTTKLPAEADSDARGPNLRPDAATDAAVPEAWPPPEYALLPRGLRWVRENPMFVSALNVDGPLVDAAFVSDYFDTFHASATHLWAKGLPHRMNAWRSARPGLRWVSWLMANGDSADGWQFMGGYQANEAGRIGYQIGDEPGTLEELHDMEVGVDAVRAADPDALIYVNFQKRPTPEMLDYYATMDGDVVSFDYYDPDKLSYYEHLARFRNAGLAQDRPYWRYSKAYYESSENGFSPAQGGFLAESDLRWGALVGLTYGYTGHTFFFYQIAAGTPDLAPALFVGAGDPNKRSAWQWAAQINAELINYGRAITQLTSADVRYLQLHSIPFVRPDDVVLWQPGAGGDEFLAAITSSDSNPADVAIGFFRDVKDEEYVIVQNLRHKHAPFPIAREDALALSLSFDFSSAPPNVDASHLWWLNGKTGAVESVALTGSGTSRSLEINLAAGDIFFFKYATGRSFLLQPEPAQGP